MSQISAERFAMQEALKEALVNQQLEIERLRGRERDLLARSNAELEKRQQIDQECSRLRADVDLARDAFGTFVAKKVEWSRRTFGHQISNESLLRHLELEINEIRSKPGDTSEWIDGILILIDGYCRNGGKPKDLFRDLRAKHKINEADRRWTAPVGDEPAAHIPTLSETDMAAMFLALTFPQREAIMSRFGCRHPPETWLDCLRKAIADGRAEELFQALRIAGGCL